MAMAGVLRVAAQGFLPSAALNRLLEQSFKTAWPVARASLAQ
jgi:hypothetical protein